MMNKEQIICKTMQVWSAGEKGKEKKTELILGYVITVLWILSIVCVFVFSEQETIGMRLLETSCLGFFISFLGISGPALVMTNITARRRNKLITLHMYDIKDFISLGEIPEHLFIAFIDNTGAVLCEKKFENQYNDWIGHSDSRLSYEKFVEFYQKNFVSDEELKNTDSEN